MPANKPLELTDRFLSTAFPIPSPEVFSTQFACHMEEMAEGLETVEIQNPQLQYELNAARATLARLSKIVRKDKVPVVIKDPIGFLDAACDVTVTAFSSCNAAKLDYIPALHTVALSNLSKFVDGKALYDESGKLIKGPMYIPPDLTPFVGV